MSKETGNEADKFAGVAKLFLQKSEYLYSAFLKRFFNTILSRMKAKHGDKSMTSSNEKKDHNKDLIKTKTAMDLQNKIADLTKWRLEDLRAVSLEVRLKGTGTKEELIDRLKPVQENKELLKKRLSQVNTMFVFKTSMESSEIPPSSSACNAHPSLYPKVNFKTIFNYTSFKKQGSQGQSRKARRMLFSKKIKTVKCMYTGGKTFDL